ncbi:class I SAM-dependent methyltransferase [Gracilibacillus suaedae]|uniref:class I SAM-dependent methyltransferase n=1 Tax=Gracilibacillus suaedae TaxID=2820273 RepID=UPI001ABECE52|nr:class I SAM-dependent methyltransferase [Gracilibacillus suaedae]
MNSSEHFWDQIASKYDQIENKDEQIYNTIIKRTKTHLKASDTVLDYGCGTGLISTELAEYVKEIHAIDISSNMIEIAEKKAKKRNIANIHYSHSTIFDKKYKEGSLDVILVFHVLHLLEEEHIALQRMNDMLKSDEFLITATPCMGEKILLKNLLFFAAKVGLVPNIRPFKIRNLVNTMKQENFSIVEMDCLKNSSQEYFIVARKI